MEKDKILDKYQNCWFQRNCKETECPYFCLKYEHLKEMFQMSGLNENQWYSYKFELIPSDSDAYDYLFGLIKNIGDWQDQFNSLGIWSHNYLNGKTTWAIKLLQNYFVKWIDYRFEFPCGYFITANKIKEVFKNQVEDSDTYNKITNILKNTELLVIDNIDNILGDVKVENYLANILDERYMGKHSLIFTSHLSPEEIKQRTHNEFLISRLIALTNTFLEFKAPSYDINKEVK